MKTFGECQKKEENPDRSIQEGRNRQRSRVTEEWHNKVTRTEGKTARVRKH